MRNHHSAALIRKLSATQAAMKTKKLVRSRLTPGPAGTRPRRSLIKTGHSRPSTTAASTKMMMKRATSIPFSSAC
jgi:hypothetical protein